MAQTDSTEPDRDRSALAKTIAELADPATRREFLSMIAVDKNFISALADETLTERDVTLAAISSLAVEVVGLGMIEMECAEAVHQYEALSKATGATWLGIMGLPAPAYVTNDDTAIDDDGRDLCARSYFAGVTIRERTGIDGTKEEERNE